MVPFAKGPGDLILAKGLRMRWNEYSDGPEACTGWTTQITVLATAGELIASSSSCGGAGIGGGLYAQTVIGGGKTAASAAGASIHHSSILPPFGGAATAGAGRGGGGGGGGGGVGSRVAEVAAWAMQSHPQLLTTAADAAARLRASISGAYPGGGAPVAGVVSLLPSSPSLLFVHS